MSEEVWKNVVSYGREGVPEDFYKAYQVSNFGRIKNPDGKLRPTRPSKDGYVRVGLIINGVSKVYTLHRLVCMAFHGRPTYEQQTVNHIDADRIHNHADNLEWLSAVENLQHTVIARLRNNKSKYGEGYRLAMKCLAQSNLEGDELYDFAQGLYQGARYGMVNTHEVIRRAHKEGGNGTLSN